MTCPRLEELSDFALGKLGEQSLEVVAEHLDACHQCQETVARLASDDTFVAKLKSLPDAPAPTVTLSPESQAPGRSGVGQRSTGPAVLGIIGACQAASQRGVMNVSLAELAACVVDLECASNAEISTLVESLPADKREDSQELARSLVQAQKVTKFQATLLLKGQGKSLLMGDYVVLDRIGAGGMGQVFRARHRRMDRIVAVKVISSKALAKPDVVQRFQREVKAAARLIHPHIVTAFDAGEQNGAPYLVMELVEGPDLATVLKKQGPLPVGKTLELIQQAARGLAFAHAKGVVHRDVKPGNLLVGRDGVKILDMGLARLDDVNASAEQRAAAELTQDGDVMGTIDYMAPEQVVNTRNADAKSDVYSLGCTLFRLLTGKQLFAGQTLMECIMAHREQPAPAASTYRPEVPPAVDQLIQRMVAKRPDERPTMTEVVTAIDQLKRGAPVVLPAAPSAVPVAAAAPQPTPAPQPVAIPQATSIPQAAAIPQATTIPPAVSHATAPSIPLTKSLAGKPPKRGGGLKWLAAAAGFLLVAFGVVVVIRDKDGNKVAEVNVPDGGSVTVENGGESKSPPVEKQPSEPAPTTAPVQPTPAPVVPATSTPTTSVTPPTMPAPATPIAPAAANGNYALQFDGRGAHALADLVPRSWQPPYTVEVWARVATSKDKLVLQLPGVVSLEAKSTHTITRPPTGPAVTTYHTSWSFFDESAQRSFGGSNPKDRTRAEWVHLAYVVESPQVCRLFIDGTPRLATLNRLANQPVTSTSLVLAQGGIKPTLLHSGTSQAWADFVGDIDEIRISANARYSSSFLPQRRFEPDAETLALYHFDEGQGNVFNDATGKQPPGRIVGAKWIAAESEPPANELPPVENTFVSRATGVVGDAPAVPTVLGHALQFNGINAKAVATLLDREWKPPYTFEAWVHAVPNERRRVFEVPDLVWMSVDKSPVAGLLNPIEWRFGMPPIDRTYYAPHPQYVSKSSWVHVAYSINSKDFVAIFVQGNQQMQYPHPAKNTVTGLRQLIIGEQGTARALAQEGPFSFRSFQGSIDELRISSIARYNNSFMSFMPERRFEPDEHTVALYHFDEGVGDEFKDSSGNNQHGKLFGAKWISTTTPPSLTPSPVAVAAQPQPSTPIPATPAPVATPRTPLADTSFTPADYDRERRAAAWVVQVGGIVNVMVGNTRVDVRSPAAIPKEDFFVRDIALRNLKNLPLDGLSNLAGLKRAEGLELTRTTLTDAGLASVLTWSNLGLLNLYETQITDVSVAKLGMLKTLKTLELGGNPGVTSAAVEQLRRVLPSCKIDWTPVASPAVAANPNMPAAPITVQVQPTPGGFFGEASPNTPLGGTADTRDPNRPRVDPPAADKLAEATKTVRELFKAEFAKKKPEEQRVLLTLLLGQGGATKDDLVGRFALLLEARNIAAELADVAGMTNAVASASDLHKIDEAEWLADGVDLALKKPIAATNAKQLAKYLDERVTLALNTDNFTGGKRLLDLAVSASRKSQDAALTKSLVERGKAFDAQRKAFEAIEKARATLKTSPDDTAANLTMGKYWCFVTGEWPLGLTALAKCDDAQIVELAQASLANPQTPAEQVALADQWWSKVDKKTALTKFELQFAAVHWYQLAQGQADGLLKAKVEKRLTEAQEAIKAISRDARPERAAENTTASTAPAPANLPSATTPMPTSKPATPIAPAGPAAALGTPRQIAESYLKLGGTVRVKTDPQTLPTNVANLASLPAGNFTVVDLRLTNLTTVNDNVVAGIRGLPDLTHLYLNGSAITDQALAHATGLTKLEVVNLSGSPQLTDKVLFHLAQIKTLQQVVLNSASVSDRGLTQLKTLTELENISLVGTQVTGSFLSELKGLEKLTQVNLANTPVDDRALGLMKLLPKLQFIDLSKTRITDAGLSQLKDHPALKGVYCADTAISDAGLKWLQNIKTLETVRAQGTRVTSAGVMALNQVLPKCRVDR